GNGNVGVAAGWDADAGYDAATGEFDGSNGLTLALASGECRTMQTLVLDFAALAADPASWGNNGGVATIGGGAQTAGVAVGSARGTTTVLGDAVKVIGGNAPGSGHALVGFAPVIGVSPTGDITVLAKGGGVAVEGGNVALAYAQIGHRAVGPAIPSLSGAIRVESLGNLSLKGGGGVVSSAQIGHGANSATADLVGEVTVKVSGGIEAIGGNGGGAYSQIGHGGLFAKGSMKDTIKVDAGGDVLLLAPNLAGLAYAKIGHGDDVRGGGGGDGDREGDIEVTSGGSIELRSALVGHVNGDSPATPVAGSHTWIALVDGSGDLLVDPSAGSLIADAASEFSGAEEVRLYVPRRASNQVAAGAKINGETYDGGVSDPWPVQRDDEYTNHILYEDGTTGVLGQRDDTLLGSGPDPVVPARYAFYYDLIEIGTPPPVVVPTDPGAGGNGGSNMGGGGKAPARLDYRRLLPDDRTHDKWRREQEREYSRWGDY
ncbi:MAG TPA: hypothetical protein PLA50_04750, partial [Bacteroidia bacterium]|nr:hypothetical protein [Bacteroidia bacterium]